MRTNTIAASVLPHFSWMGLTALCCLAWLPSPTAAQDQPERGFGVVPDVVPLIGTAWVSATLQNEDVLVFDGVAVELYNASGFFLETLVTLPGSVFPSFIELAPDESFAVIGESSNGSLMRVELSGGSSLLGTLLFNYDAAFEDANHLIVSAAASGFGVDNEVWRVQISAPAQTLLGTIPGSSGPIALDDMGNLYYGTVSGAFPPAAAQTDVLRFDAALLASGVPFDATDASVLASGLAGASSMAFDSLQDTLFIAENNFGTGVSRISRLTFGSSTPEVLVEGRPFFNISQLEFRDGGTAALFEAFQPEHGGSLRYQTTDFVMDIERKLVQPARPTFLLQGPGTIGVGAFDASIFGGPELGFGFVCHGPSASFDWMETPIPFGGLPLFLGLDLPSLLVHPSVLLLDDQGELSASFFNGGGLSGSAAQMVLFNADLSFAGSSTAAFLN